MEINITHLLHDDINLMLYSASAAELGQDAGKVTWENAVDAVTYCAEDGSCADQLDHVMLKTAEQLQAARDYFRDSGGWSAEEINSWNTDDLNALMLQFVAGDLREYLEFEAKTPEEFEKWNQNYGGRIYRCDIEGHPEQGQLFYYLGN